MRKIIISLVAVIAFAGPALAGGDYRSKPNFDGYSYTRDGKRIHQHYNERLGGYPAPRCYTSGKRTDCYWRNQKDHLRQ